ncbi:MAG: septal ring lytic transglycosylase RlpA family protein [Thermodesulfobacteriota bacterium]
MKTQYFLNFLIFFLLAIAACAPLAKERYYAPRLGEEEFWQYREVGLASWYGAEYHGRPTANGEIYDMYASTAAHRTLPFHTIVRVVNLENGKATKARINDRGPFIPGRIIDLSRKGAQEIGILTTGTARVSLEVIGFTGKSPPSLEGTFTIQVGAFAEKENAWRLQERLQKRYDRVHIALWENNNQRFYRVRVGSFRTEAEARRYGEFLRQENLPVFIVRED